MTESATVEWLHEEIRALRAELRKVTTERDAAYREVQMLNRRIVSYSTETKRRMRQESDHGY